MPVMHRRSSERLPAARRRVALLLAACLAVPALLVAGASTAWAHDELVGSVPSADATVPAGPRAVELRMSRPAQELGTRVVVTGPGGTQVSAGGPRVEGATVVQPLAADLPGGAYAVAWQVTSSDGHPLSGTFSFTVAAADPEDGATTGTPDASEAPAADAADATEPGVEEAAAAAPADSSSPAGWIAVGAVVVLVAAAALGVRQLRRR